MFHCHWLVQDLAFKHQMSTQSFFCSGGANLQICRSAVLLFCHHSVHTEQLCLLDIIIYFIRPSVCYRMCFEYTLPVKKMTGPRLNSCVTPEGVVIVQVMTKEQQNPKLASFKSSTCTWLSLLKAFKKQLYLLGY